jgi:hypothetical protein
MRPEHDEDVLDRALPDAFEHRLEENALFHATEAPRRAGGQDDCGG